MKVHKENNKFALEVTAPEATLLNNALNEIINGPNAIEDREFQTRTGYDKKDAEAFLKELTKAIS